MLSPKQPKCFTIVKTLSCISLLHGDHLMTIKPLFLLVLIRASVQITPIGLFLEQRSGSCNRTETSNFYVHFLSESR